MGSAAAAREAGAETERSAVRSRTIRRLSLAALLSLGFDLAGKSYGGRTFILAEPATTVSQVLTLFYLPHLFVAYAVHDPIRLLFVHLSGAVADLAVVVVVMPISYFYIWAGSTIVQRFREPK